MARASGSVSEIWRSGGFDRFLHCLEVTHLPAQRIETLGQPRGPELGDTLFLSVGRIEHLQIPLNAGVDLLQPALDRRRREVAVACVHRTKATAVDRYRAAG